MLRRAPLRHRREKKSFLTNLQQRWAVFAFIVLSLSLLQGVTRLSRWEKRPESTDLTNREWARNIIVSEHSGLVFCPVPKAANSNWKYLIRKWEGLEDYASVRTAHNADTSGLRYLSDYSPGEAQTILKSPRFFKFVFVRDPYARALSAYMDKIRNVDPRFMRDEYRIFLAALLGWRYARGVQDLATAPRPSFATFINALAQTPREQMNAHWRPQTDLCGLDEIRYDFIGRMEHLLLDAQKVFDALNRSNEQFPSHSDVGFPPSGASSELADELYTLDLMFKVRVIYEKDFSLLGY